MSYTYTLATRVIIIIIIIIKFIRPTAHIYVGPIIIFGPYLFLIEVLHLQYFTTLFITNYRWKVVIGSNLNL